MNLSCHISDPSSHVKVIYPGQKYRGLKVRAGVVRIDSQTIPLEGQTGQMTT